MPVQVQNNTIVGLAQVDEFARLFYADIVKCIEDNKEDYLQWYIKNYKQDGELSA